jgi:hypothetical protein
VRTSTVTSASARQTASEADPHRRNFSGAASPFCRTANQRALRPSGERPIAVDRNEFERISERNPLRPIDQGEQALEIAPLPNDRDVQFAKLIEFAAP